MVESIPRLHSALKSFKPIVMCTTKVKISKQKDVPSHLLTSKWLELRLTSKKLTNFNKSYTEQKQGMKNVRKFKNELLSLNKVTSLDHIFNQMLGSQLFDPISNPQKYKFGFRRVNKKIVFSLTT